MKNLRKRLGHTFWLMAVLFTILAGYLVYVAAFEADEFIVSPFNARVRLYDTDVRRGSIYDAGGVAIAHSAPLGASAGYVRQYPFGSMFAHTIGYSAMGRAGLELSRNFDLQRLQWELFQRGGHAIFGNELLANSVVTTLDADLQSMIFNGLGGSRGAVVVINPTTGAIYAMVSAPSFDPNDVAQNWTALTQDTENSPLLNRAAQGLYPPGSTFKLITAMAALQYDADLLDFEFNCTGHIVFGENSLPCWGGTAHGTINMQAAMAVSCNGYFALLADKIGAAPIIAAAEQAGFNNPIVSEFAASMPQFPMQSDATTTELIETAIGQGRTTATPLNMAMLAAAIANGGVAMQPYLTERIVNANGGTISSTTPRLAGRLMGPDIAELLADMMIAAVNTGTARPAAATGIQTAGKTGTAQNETGIDHSWFIGHAPAENPIIAVAIIIENTGGGTRASQLAGQIFAHVAVEH